MGRELVARTCWPLRINPGPDAPHVGTQQELALRAATRDHVEPAGNDFARQAHDTGSACIRRIALVIRARSAGSRPTGNAVKSRRGRRVLSGVRPDSVRMPDEPDRPAPQRNWWRARSACPSWPRNRPGPEAPERCRESTPDRNQPTRPSSTAWRSSDSSAQPVAAAHARRYTWLRPQIRSSRRSIRRAPPGSPVATVADGSAICLRSLRSSKTDRGAGWIAGSWSRHSPKSKRPASSTKVVMPGSVPRGRGICTHALARLSAAALAACSCDAVTFTPVGEPTPPNLPWQRCFSLRADLILRSVGASGVGTQRSVSEAKEPPS